MQSYCLHALPRDGGVTFQTFLYFYRALQTISSVDVQFYSTIHYQFDDLTTTEYRLQCNPVCTPVSNPIPTMMANCISRPGSVVYVYPTDLTVPTGVQTIADTRLDAFRSLHSTTLREVWRFGVGHTTYILTKSSSAATKQLAAVGIPRFDLMSISATTDSVHDLFGRFQDGVPEDLCIVFNPYTDLFEVDNIQ